MLVWTVDTPPDSPLECATAEDVPNEGIVCIKWKNDRGVWRTFEGEFYYFIPEDQMWGKLFCTCMAEQKRRDGFVVVAGGWLQWERYQAIMEEAKCRSVEM